MRQGGMPHVIRVDSPGQVHHVTARVNHRAWHLSDPATKRRLVQLIREAAVELGADVLACVLMANHFHLVVRCPPPAMYRRLTSRRTPCRHYRKWPPGHQKATVIGQFMYAFRQRISRERQGELNTTGRFWERRYDARPVSNATSLIVRMAYDHRNPVKAKIVARPELYPWSTSATWRTGELTEVPVLLREPLPFGLSHEELRRRLLRYEDSAPPESMDKEMSEMLFRTESVPEVEWLEFLRTRGLET
jgi:REP element-mobilizing transposase RayT